MGWITVRIWLAVTLMLGGVERCAALAGESAAAALPSTEDAGNSSCRKIVVYYLYVQPRCQTCLNIEDYSREAVDSSFANELESGVIEWYSFDTGQPEYEHYWNDFRLETKSLVVEEIRDGRQWRWKICEKVWDLVEDKPAFLQYVQDEIQDYLRDQVE